MLLLLGFVVGAQQTLLRGLAVGVLDEDGEQLQRVALRSRRTAGPLVHRVELRPRPSTVRPGFDGPAFQLPLDGGGIEEHGATFAHALLPLGTPLAEHAHRVHPVHGKSESPEQPRGCHLGIHFPIFTPELHLHLVVRRDDAGELRGVAAHQFVAMRATNGFVGRKRSVPLRTCSHVHRSDVGRLPYLGSMYRLEASRFREMELGFLRAQAAPRRARGQQAGGYHSRHGRCSQHHDRELSKNPATDQVSEARLTVHTTAGVFTVVEVAGLRATSVVTSARRCRRRAARLPPMRGPPVER